jgi:hypothetical protein
MRSRNGFNALSLSSISRMRASAAASFCLNVAISAAAVALRSAMIAFVSRGRADRALPPSGFAKIFGDKAVIPSRHCRGTIPPAAAATFPHSGAGCDHAIAREGRFMTAHIHTFPAGPTIEALRIQRDAYTASEGEAAVIYDNLRNELVVAKQRLSDQEKGLATARLDLPAATEVQQEQTTALFEANRAATGDTS